MKKVLIMTLFLSILLDTSVIFCKQISRTGILVDEADVKHSIVINSVDYFNDNKFKLYNFDRVPDKSVVINSEGVKFCVPLQSIISIRETGKKANNYSKSKIYTVNYLYNKKEVNVKGHFGYNSFLGKEVIGSQKIDFSIKIFKIRNLEFTDKAINIFNMPKKEKKGVPVRIKLWNGKEYKVFLTSSPKSHYSTAGYLVGGESYYTYEPWISLKHGGNELKIEYSNLKKISFKKDSQYPRLYRNYEAILKDGTKLASKNDRLDEFVRFIGYGEIGKFYISVVDIREIKFIHGRN